ncbi:alpha/beta fold hydrolase [Sphingosinicella rhizophila]|uniref:Alpha/beta hydrolase n=1 Tax=Sphingosinicella rhizophila TaxID=3050082 RepID=A0ABU3Q9V2_9SPHN|nr:alpha/beta hydrolase [Sphingosinicella sp. GR2756]MDT9600179.1 alpha/beta hydrolase [Sphingosinicella sp. GR2756]
MMDTIAGNYAWHGDVRIAFEVEGTGDPLVLLCGFSQSRDVWREAGFVDAFIRNGRKLVLVDPRGHGQSDKPHEPAAYEPELEAGDVLAILDDLAITKADILGYSRGGVTAMELASRHPERCGLLVVGGAHPYDQDLSLYRQAIAEGLEAWVSIIEEHVGTLPESARAMFMANDVEALRAAVALDRPDRSEALSRSGVPMLLYSGTKDPVCAAARSYAAAEGVPFLDLPGMNHMQAFFAVEQVVSAIAAAKKAQGFEPEPGDELSPIPDLVGEPHPRSFM